MASNRYHQRIRELLKRERHLRAPAAGGEAFSVCLAYPNSYKIGMASLGFQVVRRIFQHHGCRVERTFLPEPGEERELKRGGGLAGWESLQPAGGFDVLAFSVPFENDFPNIVRMLLSAGIPPRREERHQGHPLVIAGGAAVSINPLPVSDFIDAFVLGESEGTLPQFIETVQAAKGERAALLERLAEIEGVYVPALHEDFSGRRTRPPGLTSSDIALSDIAAAEAEFGETVLIEIGRGCSMGCRFCWAGWACRPLRQHDIEEILAAVDALPRELDRIGLIATSHYDHPGFMRLIEGLRRRGKRITTSSLRVDEVEPELLAYMVEGGTRSVSIAPEAGSDALRKHIGKRFTNEQVLQAVEHIAAAGIERAKLYYIIGLPGETDSDIEAIAALTGRILEAVGGRIEIGLSVNFFVPKPSTPFGDKSIPRERELRRRIKLLRKQLAGFSELEVSSMAPWEAVVQTLFSRGGAEIGKLLMDGAAKRRPLGEFYRHIPADLLDRYVYLVV